MFNMSNAIIIYLIFGFFQSTLSLQNGTPASSHENAAVYEDKESRINGGKIANIGQFPYQVTIFIPTGHGNISVCGGAILTEDYVLTAAQCVYNSSAEKLIVIGGDNSIFGHDPSAVWNNVSAVIIHEDFSEEEKLNDIALLKMTKKFEFNENISKIELQDEIVPPETNCTVMGFGGYNLVPNMFNSVLMYIYVPIVSKQNCGSIHGTPMSEGQICAGQQGSDQSICKFDEGDPLVCGNKLTGVASKQFGCNNDVKPGIYSDVTYYKTWIEKQIGNTAGLTSPKLIITIILPYIVVAFIPNFQIL